MTTTYAFTPSASSVFSFTPTLDGAVYSCVVTWNLFGQRWYLNVQELDGTPVVTCPVIGSSSSINITTLTWALGVATLVTEVPHGYALGTTLTLTVTGCTPDAYNGVYEMLVVDGSTLSYNVASNPGVIGMPGTLAYNINLLAGIFATSTLVFRQGTQQFEVTP